MAIFFNPLPGDNGTGVVVWTVLIILLVGCGGVVATTDEPVGVVELGFVFRTRLNILKSMLLARMKLVDREIDRV